MTSLTLTAKGQITVNRDLLAHLSAQVGDKLRVLKLPDGSVNLKAVKAENASDELAGMFTWNGPVVSDADVKRSVQAAVLARALRKS